MAIPANSPRPVVVLASTFYTAALEQPFLEALGKHGDSRSVACVPYNQLHNFLLDPRSVIPAETPATIILLLRVEDLIRLELAENAKHGAAGEATCLRVFRERTEQFLDVLGRISGLNLTLLICPSGRGAYDVSFLGNAIRVAEHRSAAELLARQRHRIFRWPDFERGVQASNLFNVPGDRLGHVPFSPGGLELLAEFFINQLGALPTTTLKTQAHGGDNQDLQRFLGSLGVEVTIAPLTPEDEETAINLIRHTTHFINTPDRKWSAGDIRALIARQEGEAWVLRVRDRFGDYGISGTVTFTFGRGAMQTGFWFLSCPVLGKQIEYALIHWMAEVAQQRHATMIDVPFMKGRDNQVLHAFLAQMAGDDPAGRLAVVPPRAEKTFHIPVVRLQEQVASNAPNPKAVAAILSSMRFADPARATA
jgi:hypothetical protein